MSSVITGKLPIEHKINSVKSNRGNENGSDSLHKFPQEGIPYLTK